MLFRCYSQYHSHLYHYVQYHLYVWWLKWPTGSKGRRSWPSWKKPQVSTSTATSKVLNHGLLLGILQICREEDKAAQHEEPWPHGKIAPVWPEYTRIMLPRVSQSSREQWCLTTTFPTSETSVRQCMALQTRISWMAQLIGDVFGLTWALSCQGGVQKVPVALLGGADQRLSMVFHGISTHISSPITWDIADMNWIFHPGELHKNQGTPRWSPNQRSRWAQWHPSQRGGPPPHVWSPWTWLGSRLHEKAIGLRGNLWFLMIFNLMLFTMCQQCFGGSTINLPQHPFLGFTASIEIHSDGCSFTESTGNQWKFMEISPVSILCWGDLGHHHRHIIRNYQILFIASISSDRTTIPDLCSCLARPNGYLFPVEVAREGSQENIKVLPWNWCIDTWWRWCYRVKNIMGCFILLNKNEKTSTYLKSALCEESAQAKRAVIRSIDLVMKKKVQFRWCIPKMKRIVLVEIFINPFINFLWYGHIGFGPILKSWHHGCIGQEMENPPVIRSPVPSGAQPMALLLPWCWSASPVQSASLPQLLKKHPCSDGRNCSKHRLQKEAYIYILIYIYISRCCYILNAHVSNKLHIVHHPILSNTHTHSC